MTIEKENKYQHAEFIVDIIVKKSGVSQNKFAETMLGIKGVNLSKARQSGKIPDRWFEIVEEKLGLTKDALIQQAKNEYNLAHPHAKGSMAQTMSIDPTLGPGQTTQSQEIPNSEMMYMTSVVLESSTVYRSALASNIRAFYQAVKGEQEVDDLRKEIMKLREDMAELKELMRSANSPEKKRAGNDH